MSRGDRATALHPQQSTGYFEAEDGGAGAGPPEAGATVAARAGVHHERIFFTYPMVSRYGGTPP